MSGVSAMLEDAFPPVDSAYIYLTPPSDMQDFEGDSDNEDLPISINHLSGRQLSAEV